METVNSLGHGGFPGCECLVIRIFLQKNLDITPQFFIACGSRAECCHKREVREASQHWLMW